MCQSNVGIPGTGEAMSIMLKVMDNVASVGEGSQILVNQGAADAVRCVTPVLSTFCFCLAHESSCHFVSPLPIGRSLCLLCFV